MSENFQQLLKLASMQRPLSITKAEKNRQTVERFNHMTVAKQKQEDNKHTAKSHNFFQ